MSRSHPPSLRASALRRIRDDGLVARGELVLVATSGGPDSQALLGVLAALRRELGHALVACGVDHGLRPEAPAELALAEALARAHDVPFLVRRVEVPPGGDLQARARRERLLALGRAANEVGARAVATGHTLDDRVETFLLRLLRGAGPAGLAVLPPRAAHPFRSEAEPLPDLIRPLLGARRADVRAHLSRHGVRAAEDPSNADRRFLRARVRAELVPLCEALSPGFVRHVERLADALGASPGHEPAGLSAAHATALLRALKLRRPAELLLEGGERARLDFLPAASAAAFPAGRRRLTDVERAEAPSKVAAPKLRD